MRGIGRKRTMATGTARGTATVLLSLSVLLAGCGGDDATDPGDPSGSPTSAPASATPSEQETPAMLEGATRVEGPGITFLVAQDYELYNKREQHPRMAGGWSRAYSVGARTRMRVTYISSGSLNIRDELEGTRKYMRSRGAERVQRANDITLMGRPTSHLVGQSSYASFHGYVLEFDEYIINIALERPKKNADQKRVQQAMLNSFRITEYPPPRE